MIKRILFIAVLLTSKTAWNQAVDMAPNPFTSSFQAAYNAYPNIPRGMLEAVSWTTTRFSHLSIFEKESCVGIPRAFSAMGLVLDGQGYFRDNLKTVARLSQSINISEQDIIASPNASIMAYAHAYQHFMDSLSISSTQIEEHAIILTLLSELPLNNDITNDFALNSHLYSIFSFISKPAFAAEYNFPVKHIDFQSVFGENNLKVLRATRVMVSDNGIEGDGTTFTVSALRSPDYGPALWDPAPSCNYSSRNGVAVSAITVHTVQGSYAGAISWAKNCSSNVSYHYVLRSSDGQITQLVLESIKAWHVGSENPYTIGYEHEGYVNNPAWYTTAMYNASADLSRDVCNSGYGINPLRTYYGASSSGSNVLGSCTKIKGHQHYPNQSHTDPGINWDWERYYKLINNNPPTTNITAASGSFYDSGGPSANYSNDERHVTVIAPAGATNITITFSQFDIEANWDYLFIYDGNSVTAPRIGVWTGTTNPGTVTSSGGALTVEFRSDCATTRPGWAANWTSNATPPTPTDNISPTTAVSMPNIWATQNFSASFSDQDNVGGTGVSERYFSVIYNDGNEWRANSANGFFSDNFDDAIHPDWTDVTGIWAINGGVLQQSNQSLANTNIYAVLNQHNADAYLYHWAGSIDGVGTNRRAGLHFMVDNPTLPNRGNSYFVWFRLDTDKIQIYKVVNDVFTLMTDVAFDFNQGQWYDFKTTYNKVNGVIDVYVNNVYSATWTDPAPYTSGDYISLRSGDALYSVNNLKVFKSRGVVENISVGAGMDLPFQNDDPVTAGGKIKSFAIDGAKNISAEGQLDVNVDWTPPADVSIVNDGDGADIDMFFSNNEIRGNWSTSFDQHSGIARYWYAIGTSLLATDVVNWTDNWSFDTLVLSGLNLTVGTTYYVSIRAENGAGLLSNPVSSDGQTLDNPVDPPVAGFISGNSIICVGDSIAFSNTSQNATSYSWNFPGGNPASSVLSSPTVSFATSGSYNISLTATGPGGTDVLNQTLQVTLSSPSVAQLSPSATSVNLPNAIVFFTNQSQNSDAYYWDFGNGMVSSDENPWIQYLTTGSYEVMMIALNQGCAADTAFVTIHVGVSSTEDILELNTFEVFPNPVIESANVKLNLSEPSTISWKIIDVTGRTVLMNKLQGKYQGSVSFEILLNQLSAGSYFLQLMLNNAPYTLQFTKE